MEKQMFEDVKVGDRVWSYTDQAWGTVTLVNTAQFCVDLGKFGVAWVKKDGVPTDVYIKAPTFFWDEVRIAPPPRPKRLVKKTRRIFVNLYPPDSCFPIYAHSDETEARKVAKSYAIAVAVPVDVPYEEEE